MCHLMVGIGKIHIEHTARIGQKVTE
jgi:hypothetical protein